METSNTKKEERFELREKGCCGYTELDHVDLDNFLTKMDNKEMEPMIVGTKSLYAFSVFSDNFEGVRKLCVSDQVVGDLSHDVVRCAHRTPCQGACVVGTLICNHLCMIITLKPQFSTLGYCVLFLGLLSTFIIPSLWFG